MREGDPSRVEVVRAWIEKYLEDVHTAFPGRIESYDSDTQTADVQPLIRHAVPQPDGTFGYEDFPVLPDVPVLMFRVGQWFMGLPVDRGDTVLVLCCESAIGHWRDGDGDEQYPGDTRRHHIAHAIAIPGLFVHNKALSHAPSATASGDPTAPAIVIGSDADDGTRITIRKNGAVEITQGSNTRAEIQQSGDIVFRGGTKPVAKEGSGLNVGKLSGQAGPFPVVFTHVPGGVPPYVTTGGIIAGNLIDLGGVVDTGQGSQNVKVP